MTISYSQKTRVSRRGEKLFFFAYLYDMQKSDKMSDKNKKRGTLPWHITS